MDYKGDRKKAGYEYLLAYKITVPIYDLTVEFCEKYIDKFSRTRDQMVQAARSGMQNTLEGNQQEGMKGYIKLCGVARGSLEELLKDYHAYARQKKIAIMQRERAIREIKEIGEIWAIIKATPTLPDTPNFPNLPNNPEHAINLMITLVNQANYFIDKLVVSLKEKHMKEGGLTEELYRKRVEYRRNNPSPPKSP
jgi:restriction system protein